MTVYVLGAGASFSAGYPLASKLLERLSAWLDRCDPSVHWVPWARNRIVQVRETFGSLDDFESILGKFEKYGQKRITPTGPTTYRQDPKDIFHDCTERFRGVDCGNIDDPAEGFYPQYLRSDIISALREFFYETENTRSGPAAYDNFAQHKVALDSSIITFNYDVALESALAKVGKWDVGHGYGFPFLPDRLPSTLKVYKLHGSVNWFKHPVHDVAPPVIFTRDLQLLGYEPLVDSRVGRNGMGVDNSGTFILPDPHKKFYWEGFWEPLWKTAAARLREASEVYIHGYSMPSTDSRARDLLFENINKSAVINVHCRSTSDRIAAEFRSRGFKMVKAFPTIGFENWTELEIPVDYREKYRVERDRFRMEIEQSRTPEQKAEAEEIRAIRRQYNRLPGRVKTEMNELEVFRAFAIAAELGVDDCSVRNANAPGPDIWCSIAGAPYYFELGEIVDTSVSYSVAKSLEKDEHIGGPFSQIQPFQDILVSKAVKTYVTDGCPVDLVLHYQKQTPPWHQYFEEMVYEYAKEIDAVLTGNGGPFQRLWVFDFWKKEILLRVGNPH
jgi:hypothetical protein